MIIGLFYFYQLDQEWPSRLLWDRLKEVSDYQESVIAKHLQAKVIAELH